MTTGPASIYSFLNLIGDPFILLLYYESTGDTDIESTFSFGGSYYHTAASPVTFMGSDHVNLSYLQQAGYLQRQSYCLRTRLSMIISHSGTPFVPMDQGCSIIIRCTRKPSSMRRHSDKHDIHLINSSSVHVDRRRGL